MFRFAWSVFGLALALVCCCSVRSQKSFNENRNQQRFQRAPPEGYTPLDLKKGADLTKARKVVDNTVNILNENNGTTNYYKLIQIVEASEKVDKSDPSKTQIQCVFFIGTTDCEKKEKKKPDEIEKNCQFSTKSWCQKCDRNATIEFSTGNVAGNFKGVCTGAPNTCAEAGISGTPEPPKTTEPTPASSHKPYLSHLMMLLLPYAVWSMSMLA